MALASTAQSKDQKRVLADCLDMLANYHQKRIPLIKIISRDTVIGRDRMGTIIAPAEVDYVFMD